MNNKNKKFLQITLPSIIIIITIGISLAVQHKKINKTYEYFSENISTNSMINSQKVKEYWTIEDLERKFVGKTSSELESALGSPTRKTQLNQGLDNYAFYYDEINYQNKTITSVAFWVVKGTVLEAK
ncbi:MAG: hypothetical protein JST55_01910 [Bacteroidetes bacterium]|nr:hypothetical protein [Bacteroidota bacterium]